MRYLTLSIACALVLSCSIVVSAADEKPLTNDSVVQMVSWHISSAEIISAIDRNSTEFDLSAHSVTSLKQMGVSNEILSAMLRAFDKSAADAIQGSSATKATSPTSMEVSTAAVKISSTGGSNHEVTNAPSKATSTTSGSNLKPDKTNSDCSEYFWYYSCGFASFIGGSEWSGYSSQTINTNAFLSAFLRSRFISFSRDEQSQTPFAAAIWGRIRLLGAPQPSANGISFASTLADPTGSIKADQLSSVGQAIDYMLGFEVRLHQWDTTDRCWIKDAKEDSAKKPGLTNVYTCKDNTTDQNANSDGLRTSKSSTRVSFILGGGATTPLPADTVVDTFNAPAVNSSDCQEFARRYPTSPNGNPAGVYPNTNPNPTTCLMNPFDKTSTYPAGAPIQYVAFTNQDRSNFYPKYSVGFRITRVYAPAGPNSKPYSGYLDLTVGHDQIISGGKWGIPLLRVDGVYPLALGGSSLFYLFGSVAMRTSNNNNYPPLILTTPAAGSSPAVPGPDVALLSLTVPKRDFYRIGIGLNMLDIFCKLKGNCSSTSGTNSAGTGNGKDTDPSVAAKKNQGGKGNTNKQ